MFVVKQLQFDKDVTSHLGKPGSCILSAAQHQSVANTSGQCGNNSSQCGNNSNQCGNNTSLWQTTAVSVEITAVNVETTAINVETTPVCGKQQRSVWK